MNDTDRHEWVLPARTGEHAGLQLEYLDRDDPDERRILIEVEHPELARALQAGTDAVVDGQTVNPELHLQMHELVTNQIWELDPPETWETAQRLTGLGYERHEVVHMLGRAVTTQLWRALQEQQPFDLETFRADLLALPDSWEEERSAASVEGPPRYANRAERRAAQRRRRPHGH